jgi:hypothetical protein
MSFCTRNVATKCYSFKNTYLQTLPNTIFQQDQYLANHTLQFLQTSGKEIINRPVKSPDLSPTENVWDVSALAQPSTMLDQIRTRL